MKKRFFFTVTLAIFGFFFAQAQTNNDVTGNWAFESIIASESTTSNEYKAEKKPFEKITFNFSEDGAYRSTVNGKKESGNWAFSADNTSIVLTRKNGVTTSLEIVEITARGLMLKMNEKSIMFIRSIN